jgi:hypothetical protein
LDCRCRYLAHGCETDDGSEDGTCEMHCAGWLGECAEEVVRSGEVENSLNWSDRRNEVKAEGEINEVVSNCLSEPG